MDVDAITALYAADATIYPPGAGSVTGSEGIRQFATEFASAPGLTMTVHSPMIELAESADIAYTMSMVDVSMTGPDGQPVSDRLRDMHVWKKQADGSWKVVVDIWNSDLAATAPAPAR
jgi:ketosteroid isomerase-like protein